MCDDMLGTLAKWLRVAGVDCDYAGGMTDDGLVQVARGGRTVLTRDRVLAARCTDRGLYVESDDLERQLLQVMAAMPGQVEGAVPLSRCLVCNVPVVDAPPDEVGGRVPPGVLERTREFWRCPRCDRVYWVGTHVEDMERRLRGLVERARAAREASAASAASVCRDGPA
jgi:hypothetical protein